MAPVLLNPLTNALEEWTLTSLKMTPPWGQQLVRARLPFRGTVTGWENESMGPLWNSWGQRQSPAPEKKQLPATTQPGDCWAGAAPWKKPWSCWWAAERASSHMGYISRGTAGQPREGFIPSGQHSSPKTLRGFEPPTQQRHVQQEVTKLAGTHLLKRGCRGRACQPWRRHGFGRAFQEALRSWALHTGTEWEDKSQ